jgi:hypothetical protein
VLGTKQANAEGEVVLGVTIPATATAGQHTLGATGSRGAFATTVYSVTP